jgi:hypothetical protein
VRPPNAAAGETLIWKATPGIPVVDFIDIGFETVMSFGPEMAICWLAASPGPKSSTVSLAPWAMLAPVFEAEPPEPVVTPSAMMLGAEEFEAAGTTMFTPLAFSPAATVMMFGGVTALVGAGGGALELLPAEEALFPPHPASSATRATTSQPCRPSVGEFLIAR